jgi:hypothetical protein
MPFLASWNPAGPSRVNVYSFIHSWQALGKEHHMVLGILRFVSEVGMLIHAWKIVPIFLEDM